MRFALLPRIRHTMSHLTPAPTRHEGFLKKLPWDITNDVRFLPFVTVAEQQRTKLYGNDFSFSFAYNTEPVKYPGQIMTYIYRNDRSLITPLFSDELTCLFLLFEDSSEKKYRFVPFNLHNGSAARKGAQGSRQSKCNFQFLMTWTSILQKSKILFVHKNQGLPDSLKAFLFSTYIVGVNTLYSRLLRFANFV